MAERIRSVRRTAFDEFGGVQGSESARSVAEESWRELALEPQVVEEPLEVEFVPQQPLLEVGL